MADAGISMLSIRAFLSFSFAASSCYIINDIVDRNADRNHNSKRFRVIARGDATIQHAAIVGGMFFVTSLFLASSVSERFLGYLIIYLCISVLYTFYFKQIVLVDIFVLSAGYVVRIVAGGEAFHVVVSSWLFLTVFVVALFLAAGKRRGELVAMGNAALSHRTNLTVYTPIFLDGILWTSAACALVMYALYAIDNNARIIYTVPVAAYGLLRYIFIVQQGRGDPTEALLKDGQILSVGVLWAAMIAITIYL